MMGYDNLANSRHLSYYVLFAQRAYLLLLHPGHQTLLVEAVFAFKNNQCIRSFILVHAHTALFVCLTQILVRLPLQTRDLLVTEAFRHTSHLLLQQQKFLPY